jgi:hypothetical protein
MDTLKQVRALRAGDLVDLQGDKIADDGLHPEFEFEWETVSSSYEEMSGCLVVIFDSGLTVGFPPNHWVKISDVASVGEH